MKAQCEKCKEIVPLDFTVAAGGIDVTCGACGASYQVPATAPAAVAEPLPRPSGDMVCPKCGDAQPPAVACRRCGLVQEKWRGPESAADGTELDLGSAREASSLWEACLVRWDDPAPHDAFLAHCQATGTFAFAAARYRAAREARGEADPVTAARLKQVRNLAEQALLRPSAPSKTAAAEPPNLYKNALILLGFGLVLLGGGFFYLLATR